MNDILMMIQRQLSEQLGEKVDVHYSEGQGALFVPYGAPLIPANVITAIPEMQLRMMATMKRMEEVI